MTATNDTPAPAPSGSGVREAAFVDGYEAAMRDVNVFRIKIAEPFDSSFDMIKAFVFDMLLRNAEKLRASLASDASPRGEVVAWQHPTAGWVSTDRETIAMHCRKTEEPLPTYAAPMEAQSLAALRLYNIYAAMPAGTKKRKAYADFTEANAAALTSAPSPAPSGSGVRVKALLWEKAALASECGDFLTIRIANSPVGAYAIEKAENDVFVVSLAGTLISSGVFDAITEALSAAQADYEARILSALASDASPRGEAVTARYTNWRGETAERTFIPHRVFFGSNEWHPEPQVLIEATDCEKGSLRTFAAAGFSPVPEFTYSSTQATKCAGCGEHKHTPLRRDEMGGYVCLTCIDRRLNAAHPAPATVEMRDDLALQLRGANEVIAAIERAVPDWRNYRDLVDAIECKLAERRA